MLSYKDGGDKYVFEASMTRPLPNSGEMHREIQNAINDVHESIKARLQSQNANPVHRPVAL